MIDHDLTDMMRQGVITPRQAQDAQFRRVATMQRVGMKLDDCRTIRARYDVIRADIEANGPDALRDLLRQTDALMARQPTWTDCQRSARMRAVLAAHAVARDPGVQIPSSEAGGDASHVGDEKLVPYRTPVLSEPLPDVDLVVPLGNGSRHDDFELRMLLRSARANLRGLRIVHVIGHLRPAWLQDAPGLRWHDWTPIQPKNHDIVAKFIYVANSPEVTEFFVAACDDWLFLRLVVPGVTWGAVRRHGVLSTNGHAGYWKRAQAQTRQVLEAAGKGVEYFDYHTPTVQTKAGWLKVDAEIDWRSVKGHAVWSLYHNVAGVHGPSVGRDGKSHVSWHAADGTSRPTDLAAVAVATAHKLFCSYNDGGLRNGVLQQWLLQAFPDAAPWERLDVPITIRKAPAPAREIAKKQEPPRLEPEKAKTRPLPFASGWPNMQDRGTIAVAISTYDAYTQWVQDAIRSVDIQEPAPAEKWLLCDRCEPPDGLGPDWRLVRGDWHSPSPGRNVVLRETKCDHVIWLDADDALGTGYVDRAMRAIAGADPHVGIWYPSLAYCNVEMEEQRTRNFPEYSYWGLRMANCCPTPSCWRVDALREAGGWPQVMGQDDWAAALQITRLGWTAQSVPGARVLVRKHTKSRGLVNESNTVRQSTVWNSRTFEILMLLGGRIDMLPVQREWMESAELPPHLGVTIVDNSRDGAFRASVLDWTRWLADSGLPVRYIRDDSEIRIEGKHGRNWHVCDLYNRAMPGIQADHVVIWEHDVVPPPDALRQLVDAVVPGTRVGIMAAAYPSRGGQGKYVCATQDLSRGFHHVRFAQLGGEPVQVLATGGGFTLVDNAALRQCLPCRFEFRQDGTAIGWDGSLGLDMNRFGWSVWLHGGVRCEHRWKKPASA